MQIIPFSNGGWVIHKIILQGAAGRFSAWFNKDKGIVDAEQIDSLNRSRSVKVNGPTWKRLQDIARIQIK